MFRMTLYFVLDYLPQFYVDIIYFIAVKVKAFSRQVSRPFINISKVASQHKTYDYI